MVLAQECEKRLRFVDRDTVELYKKIFGYSCISILDECPIPKKYLNALDLSVGANGSEELGGTTLVVGEKAIKEAIKETSEEADREAGEEAGREAGEETDGEISGEVRGETDGEFPAFESDDVISSLQFIIDLETISAIPSDLAHEFDHAEFVKVVERYAKGFEARGWSVLFDCRNSFNCLASEEPDACFNDSVCVLCDTATNATQEEPSAVACALHDSDATQDEGGVSTHILSDTKATQDESGFQRILVISDGSSALYNKVSSEFGKTCRVEQYWLLYFLREWIVERLCDRYASALNELGLILF